MVKCFFLTNNPAYICVCGIFFVPLHAKSCKRGMRIDDYHKYQRAQNDEIMTEYEKMLNHLQYDYTDAEIQAHIKQTYYAMRDFNQCGAWDMEAFRRCQQVLLPDAHPSALVIPPFHCDFGDRITLGEGVVVNFNAVMLDCGGITIGAHTLIGPNCQLLTPDHPHNYLERRQTVETGLPIHIGEDCLLGG